MKRIEKIRHYIFECYEKSPQNFSGCTASNIAEYFSIHRNDASSDLNKLVKQGVLYKTNHRSVLFFPKQRSRTLNLLQIVPSVPFSRNPVCTRQCREHTTHA